MGSGVIYFMLVIITLWVSDPLEEFRVDTLLIYTEINTSNPSLIILCSCSCSTVSTDFAGKQSFSERQSPNIHGELSNWKYKKSDLPIFNGENPDGWIYKAEWYFAFYRLDKIKKINASEGDALLWFWWENQRSSVTRWTGGVSRRKWCFDISDLVKEVLFANSGFQFIKKVL